jgi:hypothetical protein
MQRRQRIAPSRVRLGTVIVGIALSMLAFGMSPAQATEGRPVTHRASIQPHGPARVHVHAEGGPVSSTVRQMSRGLSYCNVIAALIPHWSARIVSASCGILWVFADVAVSQRKCVEVYVSIAPTNPISFGKWNCPT